ncbi:MAG: endopeptidase La [Ruminococcaceae bacterium]|nr:endopeptidase La [Oscillospiraceae bacterium]
MNQVTINRAITLPMIVTRGLVVFPKTLMHFDMVREKSIKALEQAMKENQLAFLAMQHDMATEDPTPAEVDRIGTVCRVKQIVKMPNGMVRVLVEGMYRAQVVEYTAIKPFISVTVEELKYCYDEEADNARLEALRRRVIAEFQRYSTGNHKINPEVIASLEDIKSHEELTDTVASNLQLRLADKQALLSIVDLPKRMEKLILILCSETEILNLDNAISQKVKQQMDDNQKEYFLREQMKVIQEELGDKDGIGLELKEYRDKLQSLSVPDEVMEKCEKEMNRLQKMQFGNPEAGVIRTYLSWVCDLPWTKSTEENLDLSRAEKILERDHFGLAKVKERILEYLAVKKITGTMAGPILCLVGPPGVGKTSIARSIAESLGRNYVRISLGGIRDEADIRGHRKTYIGSMPGRIIQGMKQAGSQNPLMLFDEIDKMGADYKGDPSAALLEVLDSEQNSRFRDHFLELEYDLSQVLFVATANTLDTVPKPLLDRMEIIELTGYTAEEKMQIAMRHLLPKQREKHGLTTKNFKLSAAALRDMIAFYTRESGVRGLERKIADVCRKADLAIARDGAEIVKVTEKNLTQYLGKKLFSYETVGKQNEVGVVVGLAWTQVGGDTLSVEVNTMPGSGKMELTGQLGDVMKESAKAAMSYVRANAETLCIAPDFYEKLDIHIHVPEGATPKDGPSAGITMATALVSALSGRAVNREVAMTGEITLRGRVLPIGGLKEKTLAAYRAGVKTVLIPWENQKDVEELEAVVKEHVRIIPVRTMDEVLQHALVGNKEV